MNNVCLCIGKYAKKPFFIKFSENNLYSIEELCYYFMENIQTLEEELFNLELVEWIRTECELPKLADELEICVRKHGSMALFVTTLFERTGIYSESLIKQAERVLKEQSLLSSFERWNKKAQREYRLGRFHQAQRIYEQLLKEKEAEDIQVKATLYYNIASVYAMDFDYEEAAEYYWESYKLVQSKRTRLAYLLALKTAMNDFDYGAFQRGHEQWKTDFAEIEEICNRAKTEWENSKTLALVERLRETKEKGQIGDYRKQREDLLLELKKDYRRQTM